MNNIQHSLWSRGFSALEVTDMKTDQLQSNSRDMKKALLKLYLERLGKGSQERYLSKDLKKLGVSQ